MKLSSALVASVLVPSTARADAPPLTAGFIATDVTSANRQWYVTGTTSNTATIATGGPVTLAYPTGTSLHNTAAAKPTSCAPALGATFAPPTPPARAAWTASSRFDTPGTYAFVCQVHANIRATVVVAPDSAGGTAGGDVPATNALGPQASFGRFQLAIAAGYTATMPATVTSSAGDATLTVHDPEPGRDRPPGQRRVLDGAAAPDQGHEGRRPGDRVRVRRDSGDAAHLAGPVGNDSVLVTFKQPVAVTDALRSGTYAKTLMFTLNTTSP